MGRKSNFTFDDLERVAEGICNFSEAFFDEETSENVRDVKDAIFPNHKRGRRIDTDDSQGRYLPCENFKRRGKNAKGKKKK